jgi:DNA-binding NtrC family response regulator
MVTDINQHIRNLLKRELEKEGFAVTCVRNGLDAYQKIRDTATLDLVILDPELLYPYGYTLLASILDHDPKLPIIVHTYDEFLRGLTHRDHVHFVEKSASSIGPLLAQIKTCSAMKQRRTGDESAE